jgi:RimJ/RimL family protein N-acetyltransferase
VVSFTSVGNANSRRVMEKIGLTLEREFDHPRLPPGDPLARHVLYRIRRA